MKIYPEEVTRVSRDFPTNYGHLHPYSLLIRLTKEWLKTKSTIVFIFTDSLTL